MANTALIGLPPYELTSEAFGVAGGSPQLLDDPEPWQRGRMLSKDPAKTYFEAVPTMPLGFYGPTVYVGGVMMVNHSLALGATARTLLLPSGASNYAPVRAAPTGSYIVGMSGSHLDVDEDPYSPDANNLVATAATIGANLSFPTPANPPSQGTDLQLFRVRILYTVEPTDLVISLFGSVEPHVLRYGIEGAPPIPPSGTVLLAPWDLAWMSPPDGSNIEVAIAAHGCTVGDFKISAVDWLMDTPPSAGSILWDSGWGRATPDYLDPLWGQTVTGASGPHPQQSFAHLVASKPNTPYEYNIAGVGKVVTFLRDPLNTAGYIDIGRCLVGPAFVPEQDMEWGELFGIEGRDTVYIMEGASLAGVGREAPLSGRLTYGMLTQAEAVSLVERARRARMLRAFGLVHFPGSATEEFQHTAYCVFKTLPHKASVKGFPDQRAVAFEWQEKL